MAAIRKIEDIIGLVLLFGITLSAITVLIGGTLFLLQHGNETLQSELGQILIYPTTSRELWLIALSFTPIGIIELGLLMLVVTQILRVALLAWYYISIRDYWFILCCVFILAMLIYSLFWR